jgi:hypothetical protein
VRFFLRGHFAQWWLIGLHVLQAGGDNIDEEFAGWDVASGGESMDAGGEVGR